MQQSGVALSDVGSGSDSQSSDPAVARRIAGYETWSLADYTARNERYRTMFWQLAPLAVTKRISKLILEMNAEHPTRLQAEQRGWLRDEHML